MQTLYYALILFLLLTLVAGLWRIRRGPTAADRMLAAQLFGTTATAILLLLSEASAQPALRDLALVLALLAAITVTAFTRRSRMVAARIATETASDGFAQGASTSGCEAGGCAVAEVEAGERDARVGAKPAGDGHAG
ncbi:MAG: monovalent cation/H+ antiporter complex subunit F [Lamprobacter sp.]|uniref:monovalent cation/H+ antiporter complex subunit F n=1 Tax=Lamprobacter sp. TaxID=3100796 RepID=UPI002B2574A8|nr:monovalent cation/H+ antiporter complex subunit F [Lamprobacter sp.]MEA3638873.1 monovalent cation/H+ antiporter complex subunit F [Lamprobacter sp.]